MAKKNVISLHFSGSPVICGSLKKTLFLPAEAPGKGFWWGESAWLCNHPRSFLAPCFFHIILVLMEGELFHITGVAIIK